MAGKSFEKDKIFQQIGATTNKAILKGWNKIGFLVRVTTKISDSQGSLLVNMARQTVNFYLKNNNRIKPNNFFLSQFQEKKGVFVTLKKHFDSDNDLRGCIGFINPDIPLAESLIEATLSAAFSDPRFEPLTFQELDKVIFEVSVLTPPKILKVSSPKSYVSKIKIGLDGLIISWKHGDGLLLPQVPIEQGWSVEEYLANACMKAGAKPDIWLQTDTKIFTFQVEIFSEVLPNGSITQKNLV